jgi:hypothetical protein
MRVYGVAQTLARLGVGRRRIRLAWAAGLIVGVCAPAQSLLNGPGGTPNILPSDLAVLEAREERKDLPCTVNAQKPFLGFDLRFHVNYDIAIPLKELAGTGNQLTILFRVTPELKPDSPVYFIQRINVPPIEDDAKGEVSLEGSYDLGVGKYQVDWLMKDRGERVCASFWDSEAELSARERGIEMTLEPGEAAPTDREQFQAPPFMARHETTRGLNLKVLVNFAPQNARSAALQDSDTGALVSLLRCLQRDPRIAKLSLVAFNLQEEKILYRQEAAGQIDFPALGEAVSQLKLGLVEVGRLAQKNSESEFLADLLANEIAAPESPDALVIAGPKMLLDETLPSDRLKPPEAEFPVFYLNYNLTPNATPWRDAVSNAVRRLKGQEFTIAKPRDLWFAFTEMVGRVVRFKTEKRETAASVAVRHGS